MQNIKLNADIHLGIRLNAKENELLLRLSKSRGVKKSTLARELLKQGLLNELKKIHKAKGTNGASLSSIG